MRAFLTSTSFVALALATPALAQPAANANPPASPPAAAPAPAAPAASTETASLGEIVVTAQRRAERLQDTPVAVTAVTGNQMLVSGINNIQDLRIAVPGLQVINTAAAGATWLRGVGSAAFGAGIENPVAIYVDGVYYASEFGSLMDFVGVSQVEVLKGPQGTLYGRNATGGLISITTKTPSQIPTMDVDLGYGNFNTVKGDFYGATGLTDKLAADFAIQATHQGDGYGRNLYNGQDVYRTDLNLQARSKWVYNPIDGTKITAIFDYDSMRNSDLAFRVIPGTSPAFGSGPNYGGSLNDTDTNVQPTTVSHGGGASVRLDQQVGFGTFSDTVAYRQSSTYLRIDLDGTATPQEGVSLLVNDRQFSNEIQLSANPGSRIKWVGGLYFFSDAGSDKPAIVSFDPNPLDNFVYPLTNFDIYGTVKATSVASYGQATAEILPATNLTLGARYTWERRTLDGTEYGYIGPIPIGALVGSHESKEWSSPTWRASLDHHFTPQIMGYVSYNTGFKSGGYNAQALTDPAFNPEHIQAWEVGLKNDLLDSRLHLNLAAFDYDYQNIQVQRLELGAPGIYNGAKASIYGLDADFQAAVTSDFKIGGGLEWLHARYDSFPNAVTGAPSGLVPLFTASATGHHLPVAPDLAANLTGDYTVGMFGGQTDFNATYYYNGGFYTEPDNVIHQGPFSTVNVSATWRAPNRRYSLALWANNLSNNVVLQGGATQATGVHVATYTPPRTFGIRVGFHY